MLFHDLVNRGNFMNIQIWHIEENIHGFLLRPLSEFDSLIEITNLLHISYKPLLDMGLRYLATYQDEFITKERMDDGIGYVLVDVDNRIWGTITIYPPESISGCNWFEKKGVAVFGQFGLHPDIQQQGIGSLIMDKFEKLAMDNGIEEIALDTSEKALHLIKLYKKRGYRIVERAHWAGTNYYSLVLSKNL